MYRVILLLFFLSVQIIGTAQNKIQLVDKKATERTKALFKNLYKLSQQHILFGHQHATGVKGQTEKGRKQNRSDVKSVTG